MIDAPRPVSKVDLNRYTGTWYEIAKIPNRFQKKCAEETSAEYRRLRDGTLSVVNSCVDSDGQRITAKGIAKVADSDSNAKLKVSFVRFLGMNLFWGDYWILGLDPDYQYAVVGVPGRKYGWVLARETELSAAQWADVKAVLKTQGYAFNAFQRTKHGRR